MPSANSILANNISGQVVATRTDTFQANGPLRSQLQQQEIASSQTSLQKLAATSPQFLYHHHSHLTKQQQMQFPAPTIQQSQSLMPQNQISVSQQQQLNPPIVNQLPINNLQHQTSNENDNMTPQSGANMNSMSSNPMLLAPMIVPNNLNKNTQLHQQMHAQYPNTFLPSQPQSFVQQQLQNLMLTANNNNQQQAQVSQQHQNNLVQQQQVPMTTIMIPATAAAHLQSASWQIQQAAIQNNPNFQHAPQILVFMIPYLFNNNLPSTPDQGPNSLNSTLVRQSNSNSSMIRQNHPMQSNASSQTLQQLQQTNPSHSRAVSSLSNQTNTTSTLTKHESEKFYIKVNFNHTARSRQELSFQRGEVLHVLDTLQNNDYGVQYWLATKVNSNGDDAEKGLIPNKNKAEEIAIEQRSLDLGENSGTATLDGSGSNVLSASVGRVNFLRRRTAQRSKSLCKDSWDNVIFDIGSSRLPTYERVVFKHPGFCRPVVIFGPLSDIAREKLLKDYPEKYSYPTGLGQSPDHPKVIRLKGVLDVIDQGKHALLDITAQAVEKINHVNLAPIVIFMKTESKSVIKEFRARAAKSLDPNARDEDTLRRDGKSSRKLLEQSVKLEKQWFHVFTAVLDLSTMGSEMWYRKLRETIENQQSTNVWMSEKKSDKKLAAASNQQHPTSATATSVGHSGDDNQQQQVLFSLSNNNDQQQQQVEQQSSSCMADGSSLLNGKFSEALNISSTKSTNDLMPLQQMPPNESLYGNRSQLRNAYAHSLAQKLARASSEPKLNGVLTDQDEDDDQEDDDEDDEDDEILKKPFSTEYENTSSISSSNGAAGSSSFAGCSGPSSSLGSHQQHSASSSGYKTNMYQHYQYQPIQQHSIPIKPPAPPPQQHRQTNEQADHQISARGQISQQQLQQQDNIYLTRNQLVNNAFGSNGIAYQPQDGANSGQSNGPLLNQHNQHRDYHPLPPLINNENQQQEANYYQLPSLLHTQANKGIASMNNSAPATSDSNTLGVTSANNNMLDLTRNHDTRNSAFQIYSDTNHQNNNYHYYNLNKI